MIYVDIKGNLGNQMFQYALARAIQERSGQTICLNTHFLTKYKPEYHCSLDDYILNNNVIFEDEKSLPFFVNTYRGAVRALKGLFPEQFYEFCAKFGVYIWMQEPYKKMRIRKTKNIYLVGYWQSAKYFAPIDRTIKKEFTPKQPLIEENWDLYNKIMNTESICVTIRRGDYVTNEKYKKEFFLCDNDFFLEGVKRIKEEIPNAVTFVFSDDVAWVRENVPFEGEVYYETGKDPVWEKLRLMSACKHFVISNSTFSWWAQHLSDYPDKIVYAPSKWFPDGRACDIYEDN